MTATADAKAGYCNNCRAGSHSLCGRPLIRCNHIGAHTGWTDEVDRRDRVVPPKCNRVAGHPGPHQQINRRSFGVEAEW